jgi:hypothetical protein
VPRPSPPPTSAPQPSTKSLTVAAAAQASSISLGPQASRQKNRHQSEHPCCLEAMITLGVNAYLYIWIIEKFLISNVSQFSIYICIFH